MKKLFTPGPLNTSETVKQSMMIDLGSRDFEFIKTVALIREKLLSLASVSTSLGFESIIMQGSGTFGIESVISSIISPNDSLLVIINGAYGHRMASIAKIHKINFEVLITDENEFPSEESLRSFLISHPAITHVATVHCETTSGIINPIESYAAICQEFNKKFIVDAMSSFGAVPISMLNTKIDVLISSSNKCIEGVPGFSFIIINRDELNNAKGNARTLTLDLYNQWEVLSLTQQFRFTPPTHALVAFAQAIQELEEEGGIEARAKRYSENHTLLCKNMMKIGFEMYLPSELQSYIISSFYYPLHPNFIFERFYELLNEKGFVIYPGKLSKHNCFRIGNIGKIDKEDIQNLTDAISEVINELGIDSLR